MRLGSGMDYHLSQMMNSIVSDGPQPPSGEAHLQATDLEPSGQIDSPRQARPSSVTNPKWYGTPMALVGEAFKYPPRPKSPKPPPVAQMSRIHERYYPRDIIP